MKRVLTGLLCFIVFSASGQAITSLNFSHWYNPKNEVDLKLHLARGEKAVIIHYQLKTASSPASAYSISWETRASFNHREGESVTSKDSILTNDGILRNGTLLFDLPAKPWLLLAKVTHNESQRSWYYFKLIESIYPVRGWIENTTGVLHENYLTKGKSYIAKSVDGNPLFVSYYKTTFPQPLPPFSEQIGGSERFLFHDSLFQLPSGATFTPKQYGLYLFQQDTTAQEGFSMRIVNDTYPKFNKIEDLTGPLIFITTPDEYKQLLKVNGDKPAFDKVVLDITRDKDRARNFMRSYFQRIEQANRYFSAYKEGWKTDRGMIYTIFGVPDELGKNQGNEVWSYKSYNVRFTFVKSGSVYNAENFILLRDKRFNEPWLSTVDLWRKSRF
ncbi:MAG: GWxTD domain-containing protein [Cyclobacteriaceae bacterium]|jgi:GWxTD domain-containing protein|nr:GWxTD domain-containing protein [Flammeovirgaceae bacterium]